MEERMIKEEKANFLIKNKDALLNNFSNINYMIFNLLISNEKLKEMDEYKQIMKIIGKNKIQEHNYIEVSEIIYYLSSILGKLCISPKQQNIYRAKLYNYLEYFKEKEESKVMTKKISA